MAKRKPKQRGYRSKASYQTKDPVKRARSLSNLKSFKGEKRKLKPTDLRYRLPIGHIEFIERHFYIPETRRPIVLLPFQKQILDRLFRKKVKPNLAVIGQPKKSGKSTLAAAIALYYLCTKRESEVYLLASDREQQELTCYNKLVKSIRMNERLRKVCSIKAGKGRIEYQDSFIQILAPNSSLAGINPSLVIAEELWSWTTTEHKRCWDELVNVPTRQENLNLVTSYAGFAEDEDSILFELYKKGIDQAEGRAEKDSQFLFKWFNESLYKQIPWVTQKYLTQQRNRLRPNTYKRLFCNEWASGAESFVDSRVLDACTNSDYKRGLSFDGKVAVGIDIGLKHDTSAIVLVGKINKDTLAVVDHKCFIPQKGLTLDLERTVEAAMLAYSKKYKIKVAFYDPFQFARSSKTLQNAGLNMQEYPQTNSNCVLMSETLAGLLNNQSLMLYPDRELRQHLLNAQAKESPRGWRLVKRNQARKIDLAVALAIAVQAAQENFLLKNLRKGKIFIEGVVNDWNDGEDTFSTEQFVRQRMGLDKKETNTNNGKGRIFIG